MKFKTIDLKAYRYNDLTCLSFRIKGGKAPINNLLYVRKGHPFKINISHEFAEYWKSKQQAKRDLRAFYNKSSTDQLSVEVLLSVINKGENMFRSGISTYWAGYARGIREHRHKVKEKAQSAFDIIGADDVRELSHELGVSEDKITSAVMEVISKHKNGGKV
jgi:hypothetical protein